MKIWLVKDGENLPDEPGSRRMRTGMLAEELVRRQHDVLWWTSTLSHSRKQLRFRTDQLIEVRQHLKLQFLHAGSYKRNLSLGRYLHHWKLGQRFAQMARATAKPDIIVCAFPIIDLAYEAVRYAKSNQVPVIVDVRDLWPDTILDIFPSAIKPLARLALYKDFRRAKQLLQEADALCSISHGCLDWARRTANRPKESSDRVFYTGYPGQADQATEVSAQIEALKKTIIGKTVFTFIGSFGRSYDLRTLVLLAQRFEKKYPDRAHFLFVGQGEQAESLRQFAGPLRNLTWTGWLNQEDLHEVLRISQAGVVPGPLVPDAMPNKIFEYLSTGVPVLSCLEGEFARLVQEKQIGFSYHAGDLDTLESIAGRYLSEESLRKQHSQNAFQLFRERFRAEEIYDEFANYVEATAALTVSAI